MLCPKCNAEMRTFDRLGIHVEQCQSCRGIFLDYGELEQIVAAEQQHYASGPPPMPSGPDAPAAAPQAGPGGHGGFGRPDSPKPYRERPDSPGPFGSSKHGSKKKSSILEQLFG